MGSVLRGEAMNMLSPLSSFPELSFLLLLIFLLSMLLLLLVGVEVELGKDGISNNSKLLTLLVAPSGVFPPPLPLQFPLATRTLPPRPLPLALIGTKEKRSRKKKKKKRKEKMCKNL